MINSFDVILTNLGLQFGYLLGGSIVVEQVFGIAGLGQLLLQSISTRDYPVFQGIILFLTVSFLALNLLVDAINQWLFPAGQK